MQRHVAARADTHLSTLSILRSKAGNHGVDAGLGELGSAEAELVSIFVALMTYVTVTVEPTFRSAEPFVVGSRSISTRSVPFCTVTMLPVAATTVPVI